MEIRESTKPMAFPLLDFVTGRARAALPFLQGFARQGLSPTAAISALRELGGGGQTQRLLDIYAVFQKRATTERVARLVGPLNVVPRELHTAAPYSLVHNYQYVISVPNAETLQDDYLSVSSDVRLTPLQIRTIGVGLFNSEQYQGATPQIYTPEDITIVNFNVSQGAPPD